jgi:MYXO-CTERM domain-containing protein
MTVSVVNTHGAPFLFVPLQGLVVVREGRLFTFTVRAANPDGTTPTLSATGLPPGATFSGTTGVFSWTPDSSLVGSYMFSFTATEGTASTTRGMYLTVTQDSPPQLLIPGAQTGVAGSLLTFTVAATDADSDPVTLSAAGLPTGATFDPDTRLFAWTPGNSQVGSFSVSFTATDGTLSDTKTVNVTVTQNHPPVLTVPGAQKAVDGILLTFRVTGSDPDRDRVMLSVSGLPMGATFNGDTGVFSWKPDSSQVGDYAPSFTGTDGTLSDTKTVNVTVMLNHPPVLTVPGAQTVKAGSALSFSVSGADPDGNTVTLSASGLPAGASFDAAKGAFQWTPTEAQIGSHALTFKATDGSLSVEASVEVSVEASAEPSAEPSVDVQGKSSAGGCSSTSSPASAWGLALVLIGWAARRRRSHRPRPVA